MELGDLKTDNPFDTLYCHSIREDGSILAYIHNNSLEFLLIRN
jgi:hypothetical protein